jgi:hypothetical protein
VINYAAPIEINGTEMIAGVMSAVGIDAITWNKCNGCIKTDDQIPIGCAAVSRLRTTTALSSPGACPSPCAERKPELITHASTTTPISLRPMATDNPKHKRPSNRRLPYPADGSLSIR